MLVSWAVGLRQLCEAYGGLLSHRFGQPCRVRTVLVWGRAANCGSGRGSTSRNGLVFGIALASLAREPSRHHRSRLGVLALFSALAQFHRLAHSSSLVRPTAFATANFDTSSASQAISELVYWRLCSRIAGGGRHGAYGGAIGLELQHQKRRRPGAPGDAPRPSLASHTITKNSNAGTA